MYAIGNAVLVVVKRWQDARVLHCDKCGKVADTLPCGPWDLGKSAWMHKNNGRCSPKGVRFYGFPPEN
jgi:hypothetical protein